MVLENFIYYCNSICRLSLNIVNSIKYLTCSHVTFKFSLCALLFAKFLKFKTLDMTSCNFVLCTLCNSKHENTAFSAVTSLSLVL